MGCRGQPGSARALLHLHRNAHRVPPRSRRRPTHVPFFPEDLLDNGTTFAPARPTVEPTTPADHQGSMNPAEIRAWARAKGHPLPDRGRIAIEIIEAWKRANSVSDY
ncbi:histone-like nucleoid-structuring protein Lsr2 [Streptomyces sp. NPDC005752]|uniref:Lsr2 family DNA-binding protein n=1 Tax=Streptomyces sp. NPDC005752 TaxID=3157065 RepID=UPI0034032142